MSEAKCSELYWNKIHENYERNNIKADNWLDRFETIISNCQGAVLDLGCGSGNDTLYFIEKGKRVIACDQSINAIKNIQKNFPEVLEAKCFNMLDGLAFEDDSFEIVCADLCLHYFRGWAVAYYQWYSSRKYHDIFKVITFEDLQKMYYTLHEADVTKFVDIMDSRMKEYFPETNLKRIRTAYGFTQSELAKRSGVSLRSIQMYEQRNKNINKASVDAMYSLAKVLGCAIEDLIEK